MRMQLSFLGSPGEDLRGKRSLPDGWHMFREDGTPYLDDSYPSLETLRTGKSQLGVKARIQSPAGKSWWLSMNSVPIQDASDPMPTGVVTTFLDISREKQAAEELELRQYELQEAQRLAKVGSWTWRSDGDQVTWSDELYRIAGANPQEAAPSFARQEELYSPELGKTELGRRPGAPHWGAIRTRTRTDSPGRIPVMDRRPGRGGARRIGSDRRVAGNVARCFRVETGRKRPARSKRSRRRRRRSPKVSSWPT